MLKLKDKNVKLTFEDQGQDFITWVVNPEGRILESMPYMSPLYAGYKLKTRVFVKGMYLVLNNDDAKIEIPYPLKAFDEVN